MPMRADALYNYRSRVYRHLTEYIHIIIVPRVPSAEEVVLSIAAPS